MTYYYYIASDRPFKISDGQLDAWEVDHDIEDYIDGFDVPIQL